MKILSNKLTFLIFGLCLLLFSGGLSACGQSGDSTGKRNFTRADFEKLRWLEGTWRGTDANGQNPFFERYRFVGDGKIETDSFSDSTLSKVDSQSSTRFENREIVHKSGAIVWTASKLDDSQIEFVPKEKTTGSFVWKKESADVWTARLLGKDAQGKPKETIYRMERVKQ
jgi:hypothetical protein